MKLFHAPTSPYARKVRVTIREKGLGDVEEIVVNPWEDPPELRAVNPFGKVPTLVLDDSAVLYDSPVICDYLDGIGDGPHLVPQDADARRRVMTAQALGDGVLDMAVALVMEGRRPEGERSSSMMERWRGQAMGGVDAMARDVGGLGDGVNLGHITFGCALGYLDFRHDGLGWRAGRGDLAVWFAEFAARPAMADTKPSA
jgi:glutathione S-transferase